MPNAVQIADARGDNVTVNNPFPVDMPGAQLPFGALHAESLTPVFQADAVYGVNSFINTTASGLALGAGSGSGTITGTDNLFKCSTGTTSLSFATLQSRRRLRYRAGQGVVARFTALFSAPVANSYLVAGVGTAESGFFFGYNGTSFGILHSTGGVRELHTLTITTASTATNDYVVTLPSGATVNVTATNNSSTTRTAHEISKGTFPGWTAFARGSTVLFLAASAGPRSGSFTLEQPSAGTPAAGTDAETVAGVAPTDTWIAQTAWNGDRLDGKGQSGVILDPSKGNVFQIGVQYLGFGTVTFRVEVVPETGIPTFTTVHTLRFPNARTTPHQSQPSFPFTMAAYSAGSTTDISVSVASYAGFIEGPIVNIGPRMSYDAGVAVTSSTSAFTPLFTVRAGVVFNGRPSQVVSHIISVHGATKSTNGLTKFYLIRNATLTGATNWTQFATESASWWDTASTGCSFTSNTQVIWTGASSESAQFNYSFADNEITLQPGETVTLAVRSVTATATCVGSLNMREDQ